MSLKVGIISYGMGNLASVARAFETLGYEPSLVTQPADIGAMTRLVLPGVGAFGEAMERISSAGWVESLNAYVLRGGTKLLGICLGMQLLAERGTEHGDSRGLGFIDGSVLHLRDIGVSARVPHVGWNAVHIERPDRILSGIPDGTDFYFVHSFGFCVGRSADRLATTPYGVPVASVVRRRNVYGTQFHPEKSSKAGMWLLKNFVEQNDA